MNKTIKMIITVLPVFLVPLILERKKFKEHPDVQKLADTSKTVATKTGHAAVHVKDGVVDRTQQVKSQVKAKKARYDHKKAIKQAEAEERAMRPENVHARGEQLAKQNSKGIQKLDKKLQKVIDKRHKAEEKAQALRQKQMKKDLTRMQKYSKQVGFEPNTVDPDVEAHGNKIAKKNKKKVSKLDKRLQKNIQQRHKAEEKIRNKRQKVMKKQLKQVQKQNKEKQSDISNPNATEQPKRIKTLSEHHVQK
ncbi:MULTISPECIES: hypothetical protein [unclassified Staphylococcus]|uniref:hypothetical protein n=1 Tax=unclassified Staphylococcus TaxID=91994 RepID=UPI0021D34203|nr:MULTISPECIES: hypothetical protein [unclassified Staphylococcus]UXR69936.1 hypothetical protein MUA26_01965 [Staphylococcus sp. IVB6246]UXR71975.1 hypothetical protein MUA88_01940 [Staphylococcus sp. IVB6240]UXR74283.1 hypothetical protein MUA48_02115 [Staphylococcus sp. IVB6238]UXR76670.1 hypothetical protein MUA74_02480 [Staphylococcus sp. IVB6233]UXR80799.1 hypothetical protein MUA65_02095 [Staphylococcus sp. IVB6218]